MENLKSKIRHVPDFPKVGILFYDITTLLRDPVGLRVAIDSLAAPFANMGIDIVVGIESRGFIFGAPVADRIGAGFAPVRKPGKLPSRTIRGTYALEYGSDSLEIHDDAIRKGQRVLIVDDLLATGGTARATTDLVKQLGGDVHALAFLIELEALNGRQRLGTESIHAVLKYRRETVGRWSRGVPSSNGSFFDAAHCRHACTGFGPHRGRCYCVGVASDRRGAERIEKRVRARPDLAGAERIPASRWRRSR